MTDWRVSGTYMEACDCEAICPCIVLGDPTQGTCTALIGWQVREGQHGDTPLDGLNAAMLVHAPGNLQDGGWKIALYLDERADERQREALGAIFSGQAGGHLAALGPLVGEVLGARPAAITLDGDGRRFRLSVNGAGMAEIAGIEGQGGGAVQVSGHPFAPVPGEPFTVARSERFRFDDHGVACDLAGRNGFFAPFAYASA